MIRRALRRLRSALLRLFYGRAYRRIWGGTWPYDHKGRPRG